MKFVLVGGVGYIGGRLSHYLKSKGHHVRVTTRRPLKDVPPWISADQVVRDDLTKTRKIRKHLSDRDVVIHLASPDEKQAEREPREALRAGGETVWNVLDAISVLPRKPRFIFLSTFHVYGRAGGGTITEKTKPLPVHPYGVGRHIGEILTHLFRLQHGVNALCVRLSNVIGPPADISVPRWTLLVGDLCRQVVKKKRMVLRSSLATQRNFISMDDAVRALEFLSLHPSQWPADAIIHVGSAQNISIGEMARRIAACAQRELRYTPPVFCLARNDAPSVPLRYSVRRLKDMGFSWNDSLDQEISNTLKMCLVKNPR